MRLAKSYFLLMRFTHQWEQAKTVVLWMRPTSSNQHSREVTCVQQVPPHQMNTKSISSRTKHSNAVSRWSWQKSPTKRPLYLSYVDSKNDTRPTTRCVSKTMLSSRLSRYLHVISPTVSYPTKLLTSWMKRLLNCVQRWTQSPRNSTTSIDKSCSYKSNAKPSNAKTTKTNSPSLRSNSKPFKQKPKE